MGNEAAIIAPIPEVEAVVGPLRQRHDRAALLGVPAHITLLYPFFSAHSAINEIATLREVCANFESFGFAFTEVRRFSATCYLSPDRSDAFTEMIRALIHRWPQCVPYGGAHAEIVPHLTVADGVDAATMDAVEVVLRRQLPIRCVAGEIWLMTSDEGGVWSRAADFRMAPTT